MHALLAWPKNSHNLVLLFWTDWQRRRSAGHPVPVSWENDASPASMTSLMPRYASFCDQTSKSLYWLCIALLGALGMSIMLTGAKSAFTLIENQKLNQNCFQHLFWCLDELNLKYRHVSKHHDVDWTTKHIRNLWCIDACVKNVRIHQGDWARVKSMTTRWTRCNVRATANPGTQKATDLLNSNLLLMISPKHFQSSN